MPRTPDQFREHLGSAIRTALLGPQLAAFLPALMLGGYWFGGEGVLLFSALTFPALFAIAGLFGKSRADADGRREGLTDLLMRDAAVRRLDRLLGQANGRMCACFAIEVDDFEGLLQRDGVRMGEHVLRNVANRLQGVMRKSDAVFKLDGPRFGVIVADLPSGELETLIQIAGRYQTCAEEPVSLDGIKVYLSVSVGFAPGSVEGRATGSTMLSAAEIALEEALIHGAASIRAFAPDMRERADRRGALATELSEALDNGEIRPWFQPQVATESGDVTGIEALARWEHPTRGTMPPAEFLDMIRSMGFAGRLSEVILSKSLAALHDWEGNGLRIPAVSVNFSSEELRDPRLCDRVRWELDRFDLAPERLIIEVMETVIADGHSDMILRNLTQLSELGCQIDLDDFGTGHASITNIRRFGVHRIKIDRSFVTKLDTDRDQRSLVAAVLTMAERLGLDTLAEGVETVGEYAILAQMGCAHAQGFAIARPMPASSVPEWHNGYREKLAVVRAKQGPQSLSDLLDPPRSSGKTA